MFRPRYDLFIPEPGESIAARKENADKIIGNELKIISVTQPRASREDFLLSINLKKLEEFYKNMRSYFRELSSIDLWMKSNTSHPLFSLVESFLHLIEGQVKKHASDASYHAALEDASFASCMHDFNHFIFYDGYIRLSCLSSALDQFNASISYSTQPSKLPNITQNPANPASYALVIKKDIQSLNAILLPDKEESILLRFKKAILLVDDAQLNQALTQIPETASHYTEIKQLFSWCYEYMRKGIETMILFCERPEVMIPEHPLYSILHDFIIAMTSKFETHSQHTSHLMIDDENVLTFLKYESEWIHQQYANAVWLSQSLDEIEKTRQFLAQQMPAIRPAMSLLGEQTNPQVSTCIYWRSDTRPPEEIFKTGFMVREPCSLPDWWKRSMHYGHEKRDNLDDADPRTCISASTCYSGAAIFPQGTLPAGFFERPAVEDSKPISYLYAIAMPSPVKLDVDRDVIQSNQWIPADRKQMPIDLHSYQTEQLTRILEKKKSAKVSGSFLYAFEMILPAVPTHNIIGAIKIERGPQSIQEVGGARLPHRSFKFASGFYQNQHFQAEQTLAVVSSISSQPVEVLVRYQKEHKEVLKFFKGVSRKEIFHTLQAKDGLMGKTFGLQSKIDKEYIYPPIKTSPFMSSEQEHYFHLLALHAFRRSSIFANESVKKYIEDNRESDASLQHASEMMAVTWC